MKEWILENTNINEKEYDEIINCDKDYSMNYDDSYILSHNKSLIMYNIINFTLNEPTEENLKKWNVTIEDNIYKYKDIPFLMLSDIFKDDNLLSSNRYGQCHTSSYSIAINTSLDIITMICTDFQTGKDFLHSVLYIPSSSEIIDYTLNLIMDSKLYFNLMNSRVIKHIKNSEIKEINELLTESKNNIINNISIKEILCFPDEINRSIKKLIKK